MLDKLSASVRHLILLVVPVVLAWVGTDIVPQLKDKPGLAGVVAIALSVAVTWLTPLTRQYGVGAASE